MNGIGFYTGTGSTDTTLGNEKVRIHQNGKVEVKGDLSVLGNPSKRIAVVNLRKNDSSTGNWGNNAYFDFGQNMYRIGASFCNESFGIVTLSQTGTYRISFTCQVENQSFNDRVIVGTYVSINNNTGNWRNETVSGRFGLTYIRDDNSGFGGSQHYTDVYELDSGNTIRIKTKLAEGNDNRNYNDTENDNVLHLYGRLEIELISESDLLQNGV